MTILAVFVLAFVTISIMLANVGHTCLSRDAMDVHVAEDK
jgi:hypothetical protein